MTISHVVGIDPSLTSTGIAVIPDYGPVSVLTIKSKGSSDATWDQRFRRLDRLAGDICAPVPSRALVLIESPSYGSAASKSAAQHDRSGLWWAVYATLVDRGCTIVPITPTIRAKYATGKGNAGKDAVLAAVVKRYADVEVTGNDVADALVLAALGARMIGRPVDDVPKLNLTALATLPVLV